MDWIQKINNFPFAVLVSRRVLDSLSPLLNNKNPELHRRSGFAVLGFFLVLFTPPGKFLVGAFDVVATLHMVAGAEGVGAGVVEHLVDRIEGGEVHQAQEIADRNVQLDFHRLVIHSGHAQIGDGLLACDDLRRVDDLADIRQHVGILGSGGRDRQKEARCNHTAGFGKGSYFA